MESGLHLMGMQTSRPFLICEAFMLLHERLGCWEHKTGERTPALHKQGFLILYHTARRGFCFYFDFMTTFGGSLKNGSFFRQLSFVLSHLRCEFPSGNRHKTS